MSNRNVNSEERYHLQRLRDLHFEAQGGLCHYCGCEMTPPVSRGRPPNTMVTIEHIKDRKFGGGSNYLNTAAVCLGCNNGKDRKIYAPKVRAVKKIVRTYAYHLHSRPDELILFNSSQKRDNVLLELRKMENEPFVLESVNQL